MIAVLQNNRKRLIKWGVIVAVVLGIAIVVNVLSFGVFNVFLSRITMVTNPEVSAITSELDLQYHKQSYKNMQAISSSGKRLMYRTACEGIVLLKNDDCLPLALDETVNVYGVRATSFNLGVRTAPIKECLERRGYKVNSTLWSFYDRIKNNYAKNGIDECPLNVISENGVLPSGGTGLFVLSRDKKPLEDYPTSMEQTATTDFDKSKHYLQLDSTESTILTAVTNLHNRVLVVINSEVPFEVDEIEQIVGDIPHAIIYAPPLGEYGLDALSGIISGNVSPSGKLADTFTKRLTQATASDNFGEFEFLYDAKENYYLDFVEGIYVGYRYYETRYFDYVMNAQNSNYDYDETVCYPFGFGASYARFEWSGFEFISGENSIQVKVTVKNVSDAFSGKDVVQLYVAKPYTDYDKMHGIEKSAVELCGYEKTKLLAPNEEQTLTLTVNRDVIYSYSNEIGKYVAPFGDYVFTVASDAHKATNNVLAHAFVCGENVGVAKMSGEGCVDFVGVMHLDDLTFKSEKTSNRFIGAEGEITKFSRNGWTGIPSGVSQRTKKMSSKIALRLTEEIASHQPNEVEYFGGEGSEELIDLRGVPLGEKWKSLIEQVSESSAYNLITKSGYNTTRMPEINKPNSREGGSVYGIDDKEVLPCPTLLASVFDNNLITEIGRLIGEVCLHSHLHGYYGTAMNVRRSPFSGIESYGEDVCVCANVGICLIKGTAEKGIYTFASKFALAVQQTKYQNGYFIYADEQTLREIYFKPVELAVKCGEHSVRYYSDEGGVYSEKSALVPYLTAVMTSSARINGVWTGGNYEMINGLLRGEWGFDGFVLTDDDLPYMDVKLMLQAGGDAKNSEFGSISIIPNTYVALEKQAVAHVLWTQANSSLMNGYIHGAEYISGFSYYVIIIVIFDVLVGLFVVFAVIYNVLKIKKNL